MKSGLVALLLFACSSDGSTDSPLVLRANLDIDIGNVGSFAVVTAAPTPSRAARLALDDSGTPRLVALTLQGEVLDVSVSEGGRPDQQPRINDIYATRSWVLFSADNMVVTRTNTDGSTADVVCSLIAARRADGALFCADFTISPHSTPNNGPLMSSLQANGDGNIVYVTTEDFARNSILYKLDLSGIDGPRATAIDPTIHPAWFLANAAGDLLINYPAYLGAMTMQTIILPIAGGARFALQGEHNAYAISGEPGMPDENSFYVTSGGGGGWPFDSTLRIAARTGSTFTETTGTVNLTDVSHYSSLYRLGHALYMFNLNEKSMARVIEDGVVISDPAPIGLVGIDHFVGLSGLPSHPSANWVTFLASTGTHYEFVRHDGAIQTDIPLDPALELARVDFAPSGAIDFLAVRTDTQEKVRGSVPASSTEVTIGPAGLFDPATLVAFTRIN